MGIQRGLTGVDLLSVKQAKARLHTLDTEFKWYLMDVIDSLDDDTEIEREGDVMDEHKSRVTHISVSLKELSSPANQDRKQGTKCFTTTSC